MPLSVNAQKKKNVKKGGKTSVTTSKKQTSSSRQQSLAEIPLDEWRMERDSESDLYALKNIKTGKMVTSPGFSSGLYYFHEKDHVAVVKFDGKEYLVARNGRSILDHGVESMYYVPGDKYAYYFDGSNYCFIDLQGKLILPKERFVVPIRPKYLYIIAPPGGYKNARIIGFDGKPVTDMTFRYSSPTFMEVSVSDVFDPEAPEGTKHTVIVFEQDNKKGVMNMEGEIIIPAVHDYINIVELTPTKTEEYLKILENPCSEKELESLRFAECSDRVKNKLTYTYYDLVGNEIITSKKNIFASYQIKEFKKQSKKVFIPYFRNLDKTMGVIRKKVFEPSERFEARQKAAMDALPDRPKTSSLDVFALADKKYKEIMLAKANRKKQEEQERLQARRQEQKKMASDPAYAAAKNFPNRKTLYYEVNTYFNNGNTFTGVSVLELYRNNSSGGENRYIKFTVPTMPNDYLLYRFTGVSNGELVFETCGGNALQPGESIRIYLQPDYRSLRIYPMVSTVSRVDYALTTQARANQIVAQNKQKLQQQQNQNNTVIFIPQQTNSSGWSNSTYSSPSTSSGRTVCRVCHGAKVCTSCGGRGGSYKETGYYIGEHSHTFIECPSCRGNKKCFNCYGTGYQ